MIKTEPHKELATAGYCWSCGLIDPDDPCNVCGLTPSPRPLVREALVGATATVRRRLRKRSGIVVFEAASTVSIAFADATVLEARREDLIDVHTVPEAARSSAWTLVSSSRTVNPNSREKFDELITSSAIQLSDRSLEDARGFALDALDADCPGWLDKLKLTASERDFLYASYQADRGNPAAAIGRLLKLPEDRYPTKDLVFVRCIGAIKGDATVHDAVRRHLDAFPDRPIGRAILAMVDGHDLSEEIWVAAARAVLGRAATSSEINFPRTLASGFVESLAHGAEIPLPPGIHELAPEARRFALAHAARSGGEIPPLRLADMEGAPPALLDDAIELRALSVDLDDRDHPMAKYVFARTDPELLSNEDLMALGYDWELARRAYMRGDWKTLDSMPQSSTVERLEVLADLRRGEYQRALQKLDLFDGQTGEKVKGVARSLAIGSIDEASNEVLTDGTTWPVLAPLLPEDPAVLRGLASSRQALGGIAAWRTLSEAVARLWDWDWEGALAEAKRCLMVARDEPTRDEALNIIGCAQWQLGDATDAIGALSHALEGAYTEGLQVNIGVVAAGLEPQLAGEHLGRLAVQAPTVALRVSAASRALALWYADPDPWDDQEDEHVLPTQLRQALRQLVQADVDEASFIAFARAMSRWDQEWFADPSNLDESPHEGSAPAIVYQAKARDFEEFVRELSNVIARDAPEWATDERDSLVVAAIGALDPEDLNPMAASFGLVLIDGALPMEAEMYIDLVGFTVVAICAGIDSTEAEPKERFIDLVVQARQRLSEIKPEARERSGGVLDFAAMRVAGAIAAARAGQYDEIVEMYNNMLIQVQRVPRHRINRGAIRSATQPAVEFLKDTERLLGRLIELVPDADFKANLTEFRDQVRRLLSGFNRLRGS